MFQKFFILILLQASISIAADKPILNPKPGEDTVIKVVPPAGAPALDVMRASGSDSKTAFPVGTTTVNAAAHSFTIPSGETHHQPNLDIPPGVTVTVDGELRTVGGITGSGSLAGTGTVVSLDPGDNDDDWHMSGQFATGIKTKDTAPVDRFVAVGETLYHPQLEIPAGHTYTVDGTFYTVGLISGDGTIVGSGDLVALDPGQNGDDVIFSGDVTIEGTLFGGSPLELVDALHVTDVKGGASNAAGSDALYIEAGSNKRFRVRDVDGSSLSIGHWDGVNNRIEGGTRPLNIQSYGGNLTLGISGGNNLVVTSGAVALGTNTPETNTMLHIREGAAGTSDASDRPDLIIESDDASFGMHFQGSDTSIQNIWFGDAGQSDVGSISYTHVAGTSNGTLRLAAANAARVAISSTVQMIANVNGDCDSGVTGGNVCSEENEPVGTIASGSQCNTFTVGPARWMRVGSVVTFSGKITSFSCQTTSFWDVEFVVPGAVGNFDNLSDATGSCVSDQNSNVTADVARISAVVSSTRIRVVNTKTIYVAGAIRYICSWKF